MVVPTRCDQLWTDVQPDNGITELGNEVLATVRSVAQGEPTDRSRCDELVEICWHLGWVRAQANEPLDDIVDALRTLVVLPSPNGLPDANGGAALPTVVFDCLLSLWRGHSAALQADAAEAIDLAECERRRLTHELHDETGQHLTACLFQIDHCLEAVPPDARFAPQLRQTREQLLYCSKEVHRLSSNLSPRLLEDSGLLTTLEWFLGQYRKQYGLAVDAQIAESLPELPLPMATAVFRIVQEATTNVARHAGARHVAVRLWHDERTIHLSIADDGVGFSARAGENGPGTGLGLRGMFARARQLGGRLTITGGPEGGTQVELTFPVPRRPLPMNTLKTLRGG